jgi:uncharacterized repeat protein (TIGR03803 family)
MERIINSIRLATAAAALCAAAAVISPAQTYTTLASFAGPAVGAGGSIAALVQATNGDFYGTTAADGDGYGTTFKISTSGKLKTVYTFCASLGDCPDGESPIGTLVQAPNGDFYGATSEGGANGAGEVFKMNASGSLDVLYSFCSLGDCADGAYPKGGLVLADGNFYGTAGGGGAHNAGTVFKINPNGVLHTLYSFCAETGCADGENPYAGLVYSNGNFYGTTTAGGQYGSSTSGGTVFEITPSGTLTTLYSFCAQSACADGENPQGTLVQGDNSDFYGTTLFGGTHNKGTVFQLTVSGAIGTLITLHDFCAKSKCTDGESPWLGVIQATDGNLYGTTTGGGANGEGTVFKLTITGAHTIVHSFCAQSGCADGSVPYASLLQSTNGTFYGTTVYGGSSNGGVVYSLSVGLGPFVEPQTTSGKVGASVDILGTRLTGATSVTFNGSAATFTVSSASLIAATVPSGATTGPIEVVTPRGTLSSNVPFTVLP